MNISKDSFRANEKEPEGKSDENTLTEKGEREREEREREKEPKANKEKNTGAPFKARIGKEPPLV